MSNNYKPSLRTTKLVKKRKLKKRFFLIMIPLILLLSAGIFAGYLYIKADSVLKDSFDDEGREKSELRDKIVDPKVDDVSVLIMGVDESDKRENSDSARTDTLMVATLNKEERSIKLLSIPRDSWVYIPEVDYINKINHAHAYGGTKATIDTVENLLEIPIDYYVKINFEAFIKVVDSLNGITVDVPYELQEQDSKDKANAIHLYPGEQLLNGEEALALARTRKLDNDIERGKRQQEIIKSIIDKSISLNSILKYDDIIEAIGGNMTTNMTFSEMKSFIAYGVQGNDLKIDTLTLEGEDMWVYNPNKLYYYELDEEALEETKQVLKEHLNLSYFSSSDTADEDLSANQLNE